MNAQLRPTPAPAPAQVTKSRTAITKDQKKQLRAWYSAHAKPPGHAAAAAWFQTRFKVKIRQPSISRALSAQYKYLDTAEGLQSNAFRNTKPKWPVLEEVLFTWYKVLQARGCSFSQEEIIAKAQIAWPQLYPNVPPPSFSNGWIQRFKDRHHIKIHARHGEVEGVSQEAEVEMAEVRDSESGDVSTNVVQVEEEIEVEEEEEEEEDVEEDDYRDAEQPPGIHEAIASLQTVQRWYETQSNGTFEGMKQLNILMRQMEACKAKTALPQTLPYS